MEKQILYIDMDGVLVDFQSGIDQLDEQTKLDFIGRYKEVPFIYGKMIPIKNAVESFNELSKHFDTYILSTSPWDNNTAMADKQNWVKKHLPERGHKRLILSHYKNLNDGDYLIDDRTVNGVDKFKGEHIHFGTAEFPDWAAVMAYLMKDK